MLYDPMTTIATSLNRFADGLITRSEMLLDMIDTSYSVDAIAIGEALCDEHEKATIGSALVHTMMWGPLRHTQPAPGRYVRY